jgi:glutathione S-transferase
MAKAILTISSKNYSSWCLRGWLLVRMSGLEFEEEIVPIDDPSARAELLLLSPSTLVPRLSHDGVEIWDTLAIAEYLNELKPKAGLLPKERTARALCRAISGEMHSGFSALRTACPMNLRAHHPNFHLFSGAKADIVRITALWRRCLELSKGPYLFGKHLTIADAMYAPVVTRFVTYDVRLDPVSAAYAESIMAWPDMKEWIEAAKREPDEIPEFESEF